jgi:hypothetical protein
MTLCATPTIAAWSSSAWPGPRHPWQPRRRSPSGHADEWPRNAADRRRVLRPVHPHAWHGTRRLAPGPSPHQRLSPRSDRPGCPGTVDRRLRLGVRVLPSRSQRTRTDHSPGARRVRDPFLQQGAGADRPGCFRLCRGARRGGQRLDSSIACPLQMPGPGAVHPAGPVPTSLGSPPQRARHLRPSQRNHRPRWSAAARASEDAAA